MAKTKEQRKAEHKLEQKLNEWGHWKRNYLVGLGNSTHTIEAQLESQEIFGDGCKRGGRKKGADNNVQFIENKESEQLEYCIKVLMMTNREESHVLIALYVFQWSVNKIATETDESRYMIRQLASQGRTLLRGLLMNVGLYERINEANK